MYDKKTTEKKEFKSIPTIGYLVGKTRLPKMVKQTSKNIDLNTNDVRIHYNSSDLRHYKADNQSIRICTMPNSIGVIQRAKQEFYLCCIDMSILFDIPRYMSDETILEILYDNSNNISRLYELVKSLIVYSPVGTRNDNSFATSWGIYNIVQANFPQININKLKTELSEPQIIAEAMEDDDISLTSFDSETDEEMPMVYTVHSTKGMYNNRRHDVFERHLSTDSLCDTQLPHGTLVEHACEIHRAAGGRSELTIVCAQYITSEGKYLRVCYANSPLPTAKARDMAQGLNYISGHGITSHAELNMVLYSDKHKVDLQLVDHGCNRATCPQCAKLLRFRFGNKVNLGELRTTEQYSRRYQTKGAEKIAPSRFDPYREIFSKHYDDDGNLL